MNLAIGRQLRAVRNQRHLTQRELARRARVPRTYISRIENDKLLPGPLMLQRIADALEVPFHSLSSKKAAETEDLSLRTLAEVFSSL